jgi:hypothetical protein
MALEREGPDGQSDSPAFPGRRRPGWAIAADGRLAPRGLYPIWVVYSARSVSAIPCNACIGPVLLDRPGVDQSIPSKARDQIQSSARRVSGRATTAGARYRGAPSHVRMDTATKQPVPRRLRGQTRCPRHKQDCGSCRPERGNAERRAGPSYEFGSPDGELHAPTRCLYRIIRARQAHASSAAAGSCDGSPCGVTNAGDLEPGRLRRWRIEIGQRDAVVIERTVQATEQALHHRVAARADLRIHKIVTLHRLFTEPDQTQS